LDVEGNHLEDMEKQLFVCLGRKGKREDSLVLNVFTAAIYKSFQSVSVVAHIIQFGSSTTQIYAA